MAYPPRIGGLQPGRARVRTGCSGDTPLPPEHCRRARSPAAVLGVRHPDNPARQLHSVTPSRGTRRLRSRRSPRSGSPRSSAAFGQSRQHLPGCPGCPPSHGILFSKFSARVARACAISCEKVDMVDTPAKPAATVAKKPRSLRNSLCLKCRGRTVRIDGPARRLCRQPCRYR